ncbi:MAG: alpha-hydroxy acid oxidase [Ilumatobacteraceae bacterium]
MHDRPPRIRRRLPRPSEFAPLLQRRERAATRDERRVQGAADIADLRAIAKRRRPRAVFDYVDGGAESEVAMRRARDSFDRIEFRPFVLRDVTTVSTDTTVLGMPSAMPLVFGPTGYTRMMHTRGETAVARVAARAGIPYALSTVGTTSPEDLATASGNGRRWFQLYVQRNRDRSLALIERAVASGFDTLVLTVDVPVTGGRLRDVRNGLTIPPSLTWRTFVDGARHPSWLFDFLTTEPLIFASGGHDSGMSLEEIADAMFDAGVTWDDLRWFRDVWPGQLVVKGVQRIDDAERMPDMGVDGIVISNHGGRQLDRAPTPLELLAPMVQVVGGRMEVMIDTGIRSGADVVAAVALGASAALVGRAYLYGLMAGGEAGVQRVVDIFRSDIERTLQLLGVTSIAGLDPSMVRLIDR